MAYSDGVVPVGSPVFAIAPEPGPASSTTLSSPTTAAAPSTAVPTSTTAATQSRVQ